MIKVNNLHFSYEKKSAVLKGIDYEISSNKLVCLLGKNGSGKSTFFKCLLNLLDYEGSIFINDNDILNLSRKEMANNISYVPQNYTDYPDVLTVEIVEMAFASKLKLFESPNEIHRKKAIEALEFIGLKDFAYRRFHSLSGGEKQLCLIARAILQGSSTILMDEPCASLDYGNSVLVMKKIKEIVNNGFTVLMITHSPIEAMKYADEVLFLERGCIVEKGTPKDVLTEENINKYYNLEAL